VFVLALLARNDVAGFLGGAGTVAAWCAVIAAGIYAVVIFVRIMNALGAALASRPRVAFGIGLGLPGCIIILSMLRHLPA
jgi:nicotinamide riboside transporter PnuC